MEERAVPSEVGAILVEAMGPRLVHTVLRGRTNSTMSEAAWRMFRELVSTMDRPVWISDALRLTGFEPSTLALGARWFSLFRERGGEHCIVVTRWAVAMMAARTMALGFGVRIHAYDTLDEARAFAHTLHT